MLIELSSVVRQGQEPVATEVDGEVVMMSVKQGSYFGLNPVGSRIWSLIEEPMPVSALCDALAGEYKVDADTCQTEVLGFLNHLAEQGLLEVVE